MVSFCVHVDLGLYFHAIQCKSHQTQMYVTTGDKRCFGMFVRSMWLCVSVKLTQHRDCPSVFQINYVLHKF